MAPFYGANFFVSAFPSRYVVLKDDGVSVDMCDLAPSRSVSVRAPCFCWGFLARLVGTLLRLFDRSTLNKGAFVL